MSTALWDLAVDLRPLSPTEWNDMRDAELGDGRGNTLTRCGRCGAHVHGYDIVINHDLGYCGCPVEHDPTWSRLAMGPGFRNPPGRRSSHLTEAEMCDRWDATIFPPCADCEHPFGLHNHQMCYLYCGCKGYCVGEVKLITPESGARGAGHRTQRRPIPRSRLAPSLGSRVGA